MKGHTNKKALKFKYRKSIFLLMEKSCHIPMLKNENIKKKTTKTYKQFLENIVVLFKLNLFSLSKLPICCFSIKFNLLRNAGEKMYF